MSNGLLDSPDGWQKVLLKELAQIASGVTKGRKFNGAETVFAPYLRVANVQAGRLDLTEIKVVEVLPGDVEKYRLHPGDILMTEGGDRDKLGRGTIWRGEVDNCIHQNHIFRVRTDRNRLLPEYLNLYLGTPKAKTYFLRAAKQTTGIASINSTQLNEFPVALPPLPEQRRIAAILDKADAIRRKREEGIRLTEELLRSTFLEMFGDPTFNSRKWATAPLGTVAQLDRGKSRHRPVTSPACTVDRIPLSKLETYPIPTAMFPHSIRPILRLVLLKASSGPKELFASPSLQTSQKRRFSRSKPVSRTALLVWSPESA